MMYGPSSIMLDPLSIFLLIVVLLLTALVIYLLIKPRYKEGARENPLDILKRRYANGEITKEEFEEKSKHLG